MTTTGEGGSDRQPPLGGDSTPRASTVGASSVDGKPTPKSLWDSLPEEESGQVFHLAAAAGNRVLRVRGIGHVVRGVGRIGGMTLSLFTPIIPFDLRKSVSFSRGWEFYLTIYAVTVFFCLVMTAGFSCISGTLVPFDLSLFGLDICKAQPILRATGSTYYFAADWYNWLAFYIFVCPAYITCGVSVIACTLKYWTSLKLAADSANRLPVSDKRFIAAQRRSHRLRLSVFVTLILVALSLLMTNYLSDLMDPARTKEVVYWFLTESKGGDRIPNSAGIYYLMLNSGLLLVTMVAAMCYFSLSIQVIRIARRFENSRIADVVSQARALPPIYDEYFYSYVLAKFLTVIFAVNVVVWDYSPAGNTTNTYIAIILLFVIGLVLIPLPRLYLQYKAHEFKGFGVETYHEYVPRRYRVLTTIVNSIFGILLVWAVGQKFEGSIAGTFMEWATDIFG